MARNTYYQDEIVKEKFNLKQLVRVLKYVMPYKKTFLFILVLLLTAVGISLIPPLLLKYLIDSVIPARDMAMLWLTLGAFALVGIMDTVITFFHQRIMSKTGHKIIATIRSDVFRKLQQLPFSFFDDRPAGKIVIRVTAYVDELADFFANTLISFLVNILRIIVVTVFMLVLNWKLALIVFSAIIPLGICIFFIRGRLKKLFRVQRAKDSNRTAYLVESINGVGVIKSFNRGEINTNIYRDVQNESKDSWFRIVATNELNTPVVETFWNYGMLMLYGLSIGMIASGNLQTGTVVAFINYMSMFNGPLMQIAAILQQFAQVSSNLERIFETIDTENPIVDCENPVELGEIRGQVDFDGVNFAYEEGINILENFNLHVTPGQTIALVGPTGAGKSTVVNLLTRFYDVSAGSVKIDGIDVREISLHSLRKSIGTLMQDAFVFKGTVLDNIRYGKPDATDEECIEAAIRIHANEFIDRLPHGYHTMLAEKGEGLSAGEKQMLSFARIMLKDPRILILDEATSSIDSQTEERIQQALNTILKGRTAFVVAHRLSTIKQADQILFISNKGIAEQGTHDQLMEKQGLYYRLQQQQ